MIKSGKIYDNLTEALRVLNTSHIDKSERIELQYYRSGMKDGVDMLVAVGTKNGVGPGCYSLVSTMCIQVVEFVDELPDATTLTNGQMYIYTNPTNSLNYQVYLENRDRIVKLVENELFVEDYTGDKYFVTEDSIKKFSEFITKSELSDNQLIYLSRANYNLLSVKDKKKLNVTYVICSKLDN